ncbi:hypothetical protein ABFX02_10G100800 [Erythranthe guttata]
MSFFFAFLCLQFLSLSLSLSFLFLMEVRRMNWCRDLFRLGFYCWCCCVGFGLQFFEFLLWRHPSNTSRALFFQLHILLLPFSPAANSFYAKSIGHHRCALCGAQPLV